jgi:DNA gyrase/topoisomerase IV subunit A
MTDKSNDLTNTSQYITKSIEELVKNGYAEYMSDVNNGRYIPGIDGFKKVQRRYIISAKDIASTKLAKTAQVLGYAMGHYHPYSSSANTLNKLVRDGFLLGQGNFGLTSSYIDLPAAAERYTEVKFNPNIKEYVFKFESHFNYTDGELGNREPEFFIMSVPYALLRGSIGIGVGGARTKIPAFTYESILEAYKANDPKLLKSAYGLKIDPYKSDLQSLWTKGHGKLVMSFDVTKNPDKSVTLSGDATPFKPDLTKLLQWEEAGWISIIDNTTTMMNLTFKRNNNIRRITDQDIYNEVVKISTIDGLRATYIIMISHKGSVVKLGIKKWLDLTMSMYGKTLTKWKELEVNKINHSIHKLEMIPKVVELINKNMTTAAIASELNKTKKFISSIESLPLKMLRKNDFSSQIDKYRKNIKDIESVTIDQLIQLGCDLDKDKL